jgi:hypothetical protein
MTTTPWVSPLVRELREQYPLVTRRCRRGGKGCGAVLAEVYLAGDTARVYLYCDRCDAWQPRDPDAIEPANELTLYRCTFADYQDRSKEQRRYSLGCGAILAKSARTTHKQTVIVMQCQRCRGWVSFHPNRAALDMRPNVGKP